MLKTDLQKNKLSNSPGVYFFLGKKKEILYIGKATTLSNRIKSYFSNNLEEKRSPLIVKMIAEAKTVEWTETDSVLEALILEANLIRTHKPTYNSISKDDKSYNHLIITNEIFPRVLVIRGKDLTVEYSENEILYYFGPFTNSTLFKEALKIIRKLFKFYDTKTPIGTEKTKFARGKIDFNRQIGLYPDQVTKKEYQRTIRHIRMLFEGKKKQIIIELKKDMHKCATSEQFEDAHILKKKIFALQHIQDISLLKDDLRVYRDENSVRIEAYDIAHLAGQNMVGVMVVIEGGKILKSEYRKFKINSVTKSNDVAALKEILNRRIKHSEWLFPQIIVVDGSTAQKNTTELVLKKAGMLIPVVAVVKNDHHRPVRIIASKKLLIQYENDILLANAEAHRFAINYHIQKRNKTFLKK